MKIDKKVLELAFRVYVFMFLNVYGIGKILGGQFYRRGKLPEEVANMTLGEVDAYTLGFTFMGYSYGYILFVGISQLIGAWLLLWDRTKLIGVTILIPIMLNIVVFDIYFLGEHRGALANAIIYFALLLIILWINKEAVIETFKSLSSKSITNSILPLKLKNNWMKIGFAVFIMIVLFVFDQMMVRLLGY